MSQPNAPWPPAGEETELLLELARSQRARSEEPGAEQRFLSALRAHSAEVERRAARRSRGYWQYGLAFAGAVLVALAVVEVGGHFRTDPLSYRVTSGGAEPGRVIESKTEPVELDFSDGTNVTVERQSRARVAETTARGARFRLDSGKMSFDVVPHADRGDWLVEAGPFQVRVTGTVFTVEWNAQARSLDVTVTRGHVIVEGAGQRRELGPGDSFHHRDPNVVVTRPEPAPEAPPAPRAIAPARPAPQLEKQPSWSELVASGSFAAVLDAADHRGIEPCLAACSREDLRALADAARLGGQASLAERTLLAQRARFAGSTDATAAAFLLGRSAEARHDGRAVSWYDTYLAEAPQGRLAGDALGRKLLLLAKTDPKRAAGVAEQYLARFGSGPYAAHAKSLLEAR